MYIVFLNPKILFSIMGIVAMGLIILKFKPKIKKIIQDIRFKILISLLKKYSNTELDQWERWEISSKYGKVYITISREATGTNYVKID